MVEALDAAFCRLADTIDVQKWGFEDEHQKLIMEHRKQLVHDRLSSKIQRHSSWRKKRQLLNADESSACKTVTQVLALLRSKQVSTAPTSAKKSTKAASKAAQNADRAKAVANKKAAPQSVSKSKRNHAKDDDNPGTLLQKLQAKLDDMKKQRMKKSTTEHAINDQEQQRLKRKISKAKLKQRRRTEKKSKVVDTNGTVTAESSTTAPTPAKSVDQQPIRNQEGALVYSKFDFALSPAARATLKKKMSASGGGESGKKDKKSLKQKGDKLHGRDYKRLLDKVEARQRKVDALQEKDPDKAARLQKNIKWSDALQRSTGEVVKDDADKLRQALKNKDKKKEQKKKKWENREQTVADNQKKASDKRKTNLQKRKDLKKKSREMKSLKRGR